VDHVCGSRIGSKDDAPFCLKKADDCENRSHATAGIALPCFRSHLYLKEYRAGIDNRVTEHAISPGVYDYQLLYLGHRDHKEEYPEVENECLLEWNVKLLLAP
jgi:hypothetical protein